MTHEHDWVVDELVALAKRLNIRCVVQVGADDGWEAWKMHERAECASVAIEADPAAEPCAPELVFFRGIIGATDSDAVPFYHVGRRLGLSSTLPRDGEVSKFTQVISLPQSRLDTFCQEHAIAPDMLIIDTEGTTSDVLEGCGGLLAGVRAIYAECQTWKAGGGSQLEDVDAFLTERGFRRDNTGPCYSVGSQGNFLWVRP